MSILRLSTALLAFSLAVPAVRAEAPAAARPLPCSDYTAVKEQLAVRYEEAPISVGLQSNGNVLQIFTSQRTGTWTVVSTTPAGVSCILAVGKSWEEMRRADLNPAA
jgi:hypothetical protein